jgi:NADH/NAD ratio-sensing transcriptional regulator Rex
MESNKENRINGIERHHQKIDDPLTKKDVQTILNLMPQGLDADEFVMRLCNEAVHYARWIGKA